MSQKLLVEVQCEAGAQQCRVTALAKLPIDIIDLDGIVDGNDLLKCGALELPAGWGWYGYAPGRHDLIACPEHKDRDDQ